MKLENLLACMQDSGLELPPRFARARNDIRVPEYYDLYYKTVEDIARHVYFGANYGFSGKIKAAIAALADQVVLMSQQTNAGRFGEIQRNVRDAQSATNDIIKNTTKGIVDMKQKLLQQIEAYKDGTYVMATIDVAEERRDVLDAGIKKMERLIELLGEISDVSSPKALEQAQAIKAALEKWAKDVAISMHSQRSLAELDKAIKAAEAWIPFHVERQGFFKKLLSKLFGPKVDVESVQYILDDLGRIGESAGFLEGVTLFSQNLQDYIRNKEGVWRITERNASLARIDREIEAQKEAERAAVERCKNGEITQDQLLNIVKPLRAEVARLERSAQDIRRELGPITKNRAFYMRLSSMMERMFDVIKGFRNEPTQITRLGKYLNFESLTRLLQGTGTENDTQVMLTLRRMEDVIIAHANNQMEQLFAQWEEQMNEMDAQMDALDNQEGVTVGAQGVRNDEDAALLEELLGAPAAAAAAPVEQPRVETAQPAGLFNGTEGL